MQIKTFNIYHEELNISRNNKILKLKLVLMPVEAFSVEKNQKKVPKPVKFKINHIDAKIKVIFALPDSIICRKLAHDNI